MHEPVKGNLEECLSGHSRPEVTAHLAACESCRRELEVMRAQSDMFRVLRAPAYVEPGPAFYARVMNRIETQATPSVWSLFGDSLFAKRLVYASATFLVVLGTVLVSSTPAEDTFADVTPAVILSGEQLPQPVIGDPQRDRDVVLVNLASYQQEYQ